MSAIRMEVPAIVLDSRDHGESDKIVTLYAFDKGRVTGIAKGAKKSKKRFLNKLELFSSITLTYTEKPHAALLFIAEAELLSSFITLRTDFNRYICASYIREIVLNSTLEKQGDEISFRLLEWSLQSLDRGNAPLSTCAIFQLRLYDNLGYRPDFLHCRLCGRPFDAGLRYRFHHRAGGIDCDSCLAGYSGQGSNISNGTIKILQSVLAEPLDRLHRLHFSRQSHVEALSLLHLYGRNLFQREMHSWKAVRQLIG